MGNSGVMWQGDLYSLRREREEMGRGKNCHGNQPVLATRSAANSAEVQTLKRHEWLIGRWEMRFPRSELSLKTSLVDQNAAKARALSDLTKNTKDQKALISVAQDAKRIMQETANQSGRKAEALHAYAKSVNDRARAIFFLCHTGYIEQQIRRKAHMLRGEDTEHALEVLRGAAWKGADKGVDKYSPDEGANPLTYIKNWINAELGDAIEAEGGEGGVRLKSKANDLGKKVQAMAKEIENDGRQVTIAEIADRIGTDAERVAEVLPFAVGHMTRMDAPVKTDDGSSASMGALILDPAQEVSAPVLDADMRERVRQAVSEIKSPFQRRIIELFHLEEEAREQKDLFDGVYRDSEGRAFSAEPSVIADRKRRGIEVIKASQRDLNRMFREGELTWEPGTPEAHELSRVVMPDYDPSAKFEDFITRETGVPPTSGTIQEAKRFAEEEMRKNPVLNGLQPRYRGEDELENSEAARDEVRRALHRRGIIDDAEAQKLMAGRAAGGGKSKLRVLAEENDLVDRTSGRLKLANIAPLLVEDESEDLAALMSA